MIKVDFTPKFKRLLIIGLITLSAVLTEVILQVLYGAANVFSVKSILKWWGIVLIALVMIYLLISLASMQVPNKRQLLTWGFGVVSVGLPFAALAVKVGIPFFVLFTLCVLLTVGTIVFSVFTVSQKTNGTFWVIELAVTMVYAGGYVLFGFLWDTPTSGFPLGDMLLIPLTVAFVATDLHACRLETKANN